MTMSDAERELERVIAIDPRARLQVPAETARIYWAEVGADRLTLDMFGQLPDAPYDRIRPVARVRPPMSGEYVIGVDPDGQLVRSSFGDAWEGVPRDDREERRLVSDLVRLRERVAAIEEGLRRRAAFTEAQEAYRSLPTVVLVPGHRKSKEEGV
jgi:hypothetical protein